MGTLVFDIHHPYSSNFADEESSLSVEGGIDTELVQAGGMPRDSLPNIVVKLWWQQPELRTQRAVNGEALAVIWLNFLGQNSAGADILNRITNNFVTYHHQVGVIGQGTTQLIVNFFDNFWNVNPLTVSSPFQAASQHVSLLWHQLEAAVVVQTAGVAAVSTPSVIEAANATTPSTKIYQATSANWFSVVKPALIAAGFHWNCWYRSSDCDSDRLDSPRIRSDQWQPGTCRRRYFERCVP